VIGVSDVGGVSDMGGESDVSDVCCACHRVM
jgi:hypothetical protein